jgi:flagellar basal-body rod modification protein FlgD
MTITSSDSYAISLGSGSGAAPAAPNNDLGKDAFLQLLVTQLRNQDPTNPQDGSAFVAQLATFSQVEQATAMNDSLNEMNTALGFMSGQMDGQASTLQGILGGIGALGGSSGSQAPSLVQAASLIGRQAEAAGAQAWVGGSSDAAFSFHLDAPADAAEMIVRNGSGAIVRRIPLDATSAGEHTIGFDGRDADGKALPEGIYSATVSGAAPDGEPVAARMFTRGDITRVGQSGGELSVWMGNVQIAARSLSSLS